MGGVRNRCSTHNPCPICGATDYDMLVDYGEEGIVYWCHKATAPDNVISGGKEYVCIKTDKVIDIGRFNLYKEKSQYQKSRQKWIEEQKKNNPDWRTSSKAASAKAPSREAAPVRAAEPLKEKTDTVPLDNRSLDLRYRYFLSLLVLENKHEERLREEWESTVFPDLADTLFKVYPIRSLPPEDFIRFRNTEKFRNPTRKWIVEKMYEKFGDLKGIPGFFLRGGSWADKPEKERFTFAKGEGIIFPVYDEDGNIYRLRYRDDYHGTKIKPGGKLFRNMAGAFRHSYDREGHHMWTFYPENRDVPPFLVYGQGKKAVELDRYGIPVYGKAEGKYKTFSSYKEKVEGEFIVNALEGGCRSGSPYSVYASPKASFHLCIATEGEKKGMVAGQIKGVPVITLPGVGTFGQLFQERNGSSVIKRLKSRGLKILVICYDADKNENLQVGGAEKRFVEACRKEGITPLIGNWSGKFDKGLDDILLMGVDFQIEQP